MVDTCLVTSPFSESLYDLANELMSLGRKLLLGAVFKNSWLSLSSKSSLRWFCRVDGVGCGWRAALIVCAFGRLVGARDGVVGIGLVAWFRLKLWGCLLTFCGRRWNWGDGLFWKVGCWTLPATMGRPLKPVGRGVEDGSKNAGVDGSLFCL